MFINNYLAVDYVAKLVKKLFGKRHIISKIIQKNFSERLIQNFTILIIRYLNIK